MAIQIKRLGAFFVSTIKSTIKQDQATRHDRCLELTGSLRTNMTKATSQGLQPIMIDGDVQPPRGIGPSDAAQWPDGAANNLKFFDFSGSFNRNDRPLRLPLAEAGGIDQPPKTL